MITRIETEIIELHQFFTDWYTGKLPQTEAAFSRCAQALAPGFNIVSPDNGKMMAREPLLDVLWNMYNAKPDFQIWIKNVIIQHQVGNVILATYEEWQEFEGSTTARLSSALFITAESLPNRVRWLHVHETWMQT